MNDAIGAELSGTASAVEASGKNSSRVERFEVKVCRTAGPRPR